MSKILKSGTTMAIALLAFAVAFPAQALIMNVDIANNAGISYSKLKLGGKIDSDDIKNGSIQGKDIKKGTITGSRIDDDAIDSDKIDDGSITAADLAAGTLTATTLADGSVTSAKILDSTIASADIALDTIVAADIALGAVGTSEILDGTILTGDISTGGVTTGNILNATIINEDISASAAIAYSKLDFTDDIVAGDIATDAIGALEIASGVITADELASNSVAADELADSSVGTGEITDLAIMNGDINASAAIAGTKISPDFGAQALTTSGNISTTGSGTITAAGRIYTNAGFDAATGGTVLHIGETYAGQIALDSSIVALGNEGTDSVRSKGDFSVRNDANGADTFTIDNNTGDTVVGGDLTVTGGDLLVTPKSASGTATEGTIYYDSDDDNLYVYANGGYVDLTAGAAGAITLDDAYNFGSGAETEIHVDNGNLTLSSEDTSAGGGDIKVDLTNEGDFLVQNAGVTYATFDDSGNVAFTGTLDVQGDVLDSVGTFTIADATNVTGAATLDGDVTLGNAATDIVTVTGTVAGATPFLFEGATANDFETAFIITDPTGDVNITFPNTTGTVVTTGDTGSVTSTMIFDGTIAGGAAGAGVDIAANTITADNIATSGVATDEILNGTILNADVDAAAGIVYSKLAFSNNIVAGDIATGAVATDEILDGTIVGGAAGAGVDIAANTITADNIAAGGVATSEILDGTIVGGAAGAGVDIAANTITADNIATSGVATDEILNGTIVEEDLANSAVTSAKIANGTIVAGDIVADAIDGASLADTITLDAALALNDFDVTIEEDLNVNGDEIDADGTLDITGATGMNINTGTGDITLDPVDGGAGSLLPEDDSEDSIGADATRWSAIYADTLSYTTALTDDNSAGTTVSMGDSVTLDSVTINANTAITDGEWSVTNAGVANFVSVGATTPGTGAFTTLSATGAVTMNDDSADNILIGNAVDTVTIASNALTLTDDEWSIAEDGAVTGLSGITSAMITNATITADDLADDSVAAGEIASGAVGTSEIANDTIAAGDIATSAVTTDEILNATIAGEDLAATIAITTSGTLTSTGTVDFSGASLIIDSGTDLPGTCVTGQLFVDTNADAGSRLMVCIANAWSAN
jgi:hypothetical protein